MSPVQVALWKWTGKFVTCPGLTFHWFSHTKQLCNCYTAKWFAICGQTAKLYALKARGQVLCSHISVHTATTSSSSAVVSSIWWMLDSTSRFIQCLNNPWKCLNSVFEIQGPWKCLKTGYVFESTWKLVLHYKLWMRVADCVVHLSKCHATTL